MFVYVPKNVSSDYPVEDYISDNFKFCEFILDALKKRMDIHLIYNSTTRSFNIQVGADNSKFIDIPYTLD